MENEVTPQELNDKVIRREFYINFPDEGRVGIGVFFGWDDLTAETLVSWFSDEPEEGFTLRFTGMTFGSAKQSIHAISIARIKSWVD